MLFRPTTGAKLRTVALGAPATAVSFLTASSLATGDAQGKIQLWRFSQGNTVGVTAGPQFTCAAACTSLVCAASPAQLEAGAASATRVPGVVAADALGRLYSLDFEPQLALPTAAVQKFSKAATTTGGAVAAAPAAAAAVAKEKSMQRQAQQTHGARRAKGGQHTRLSRAEKRKQQLQACRRTVGMLHMNGVLGSMLALSQ